MRRCRQAITRLQSNGFLAGGLAPLSYSPLGDRVIVNTAWIDWPVDTRVLHSCFHALLSAAW
jgi:hypothetical protein